MKLYGVTILYKGSKVTLLKRALDLQSFSFFQRSRYDDGSKRSLIVILLTVNIYTSSSIRQAFLCQPNWLVWPTVI